MLELSDDGREQIGRETPPPRSRTCQTRADGRGDAKSPGLSVSLRPDLPCDAMCLGEARIEEKQLCQEAFSRAFRVSPSR